MVRKSFGCCLLALFLILLGNGCKKTESDERTANNGTNSPVTAVLQPVTVFRLRWIGTKRLASETNATGFNAILGLPETKLLEAQTLDRLGLALGGSSVAAAVSNPLPAVPVHPGITNPPARPPAAGATNSPVLRPILDDLLSEESYWEARQSGSKPGEVAVAIHLSEDRAQLWLTNLTAVFGRAGEGVAGQSNVLQAQWQLTNWPGSMPDGTPAPRTLSMTRLGGWTVLGLSAQTNGLAGEFAVRIPRDGTPFQVSETNSWLTAEVNPSRASSAFALGGNLPDDLPVINLEVTGDGEGVRTHTLLTFPKPLATPLEAWNIPTNLIHDPLISFTAMRGLRQWWSPGDVWKKLDVGSPPDQLYLWGHVGPPFLCYAAVPLSDGSNVVRRVSTKLMEEFNPWFETNGIGNLQLATDSNGVVWSDLGIIRPYLKWAPENSTNGFAFAGLITESGVNQPLPAELAGQILNRTNLIGYDWELTGMRIEQWLHFGQFIRFALHRAQIPPKSASFAWLKAIAQRLSNSVTMVSQTGPNEITIGRNSGIGLTSAELDLLADWLESPRFPCGLNTFLGEPTPVPSKLREAASHRDATNAVPRVKH